MDRKLFKIHNDKKLSEDFKPKNADSKHTNSWCFETEVTHIKISMERNGLTEEYAIVY